MTTEFPGARIETDLNLELIDDFPVWNRKHSHPPVAAGKAIELADRYRTIELLGHKRLQAVNQSHDWVFQSVELAPLRPGKGVWVWVVNYNLRKTNIWYVEPDPRVVSIVVKMDGGIVEPRIF